MNQEFSLGDLINPKKYQGDLVVDGGSGFTVKILPNLS